MSLPVLIEVQVVGNPVFPPQKYSQMVYNSYLKTRYYTKYVTSRKRYRFLLFFFIKKAGSSLCARGDLFYSELDEVQAEVSIVG